MTDKPQISRIPRHLVVGDVVVEAIVLHPAGGRYALDTVDIKKPGHGVFRLTPRQQSHETFDGVDDELRKLVRDINPG